MLNHEPTNRRPLLATAPVNHTAGGGVGRLSPATAIIFPRRQNFLEAITEAVSVIPPANASLYHNGQRCAWLPTKRAGWFPINAVAVKVAA